MSTQVLRDRLDTVSAYRELFLDGEGRLTGAGRLVLRDMSAFAGVSSSSARHDNEGRIDPAAHVYRDGQKAVFMHVEKRLAEDPASILDQIRRNEME